MEPEGLVHVVHPVHLSVTCQCVELTLVPVLRTWSVSPAYAVGMDRVLYISQQHGKDPEHVPCHAYFVYRLDTVTEFPFAHAMVKGTLSMVPPQARPSQPTSFRAITCRTISYGAVAGFGTAVRKLMTLGLLYLYCALY